MGKPGSIFISYRRSDSIAEAGRVYDELVEAFGSEQIFKDVDSIPYGADFVEYLDQAVAQCDVLIPLIGRSWLTVTDTHGNRRLDDPYDFVRIEIASALKRDILVIPILVGGATMPGPDDLPEDLKSLARRNAAQARYDPDFHDDMERIIEKLQEYFVDRGLATKLNHNVGASSVESTMAHSNAGSKTDGILIPIILSGISGVLALYYNTLVDDVAQTLVVGVLLLGTAAAMITRKHWAWGIAIATQILAIVIFCAEIIDIVAEGWWYDLVVIFSIVIFSLITTIVLLLPKTHRNFR
ncbi:MAG: TIR domain-containing protein [Leptolyngbyaceae cyanobacterium MAG.088]|nr:TIR domain-containing protein [Leptolyngbyaceae cyanobacterium MAG.088]